LLAPALLAGAALWWPLQVVLGPAASSSIASLAWSLALAMLTLAAVVTAHLCAVLEGPLLSQGRTAVAAASLLLCVMALGLVTPVDSAWATARALAGGLVLFSSLYVLARPATAAFPRARAAAALIAAAVLACAGLPQTAEVAAWTHPALWPTLALGVLALSQRMVPYTARGTEFHARARVDERANDPLTTLPTRTHFEQQLAGAVVRSDANGEPLALLFIDLDGFKPVNDTFGHSCGDAVLRSVGERLKACTASGDAVARVGGDEFLMLLNDARDKATISQRAHAVVEALSKGYEVDGRQVTISCSVGVALYPQDGQHAKLVARADAAMYTAKRSGGSGVAFYTPALEDDARERFDLLRELRDALEHKQLELFYQPKIGAASRKITAAEALIRWNHPKRGLLGPEVFMPIAERFGLIRAIGHWVIDDACRQARVWRDSGLRMRMAINLSALQMRQDDIVERLQGALQRHGIDPRSLTCEITESVAMEDTKITQSTLRALGAAGIHVSIDDFGTGYSSLSYLRRLPAEELKIDRSFVMDVEFSADARAVVDAVVRLAHALGLKVVAEGVENERQCRILSDLGCDELQGFMFAKPMTARALLLWALDDRDTDSPTFASSLFGPTTARSSRFATTTREAGDERDANRKPKRESESKIATVP
jgi:diguanylate cyclase (GGDEF)-like protein